ncbi:DUF58 domain-containing protein [Algivirga pacifica]|uniref:DUF58 domain-containing protein n=1 Tax=Algivirga pacifica TaxID=1162670 RepID=A0ABP9DKX0_9BACT
MSFFRNLYFSANVFIALGGLAVLFVVSFFLPILYPILQGALLLLWAIVCADIYLLFYGKIAIKGQRILPKVLSLGAKHKIQLFLQTRASFPLRVRIYDELPKQLQERKLSFQVRLAPRTEKMVNYTIRPLSRGVYDFGDILLYVASPLRMVHRRITIPAAQSLKVYPSLVEMKEYEFYSLSSVMHRGGLKKIRKIGQSHEFEQIKNYVAGDDYQKINWKASSKGQGLMVNHYQDEKSQPVYMVLDKSRSMHMPFNGLSLLDYAINTSLTFTNVAVNKQDKAGLITFSDKVDTVIKAVSDRKHIKVVMEALYNEEAGKGEADYTALYKGITRAVTNRSLLFLLTNFESKHAMEQAMPLLRQLNRRHLLVTILFENTELKEYTYRKPETLKQVYYKTMAEKLLHDKQEMVRTINQYGIQTILTKPELLTVDVLNKYLELKSRGML